MTTEAFVGNIFLARGDGGTPEVFTRVCQVFGLSGIGQTNALVDATTFCSGGTREYIGGLADGQEITVEANYERASAALAAMIVDVKNKATRHFELQVDSGSPQQTLSFSAIMLSWVINPSVADRNTISFTMKISGDVVIT